MNFARLVAARGARRARFPAPPFRLLSSSLPPTTPPLPPSKPDSPLAEPPQLVLTAPQPAESRIRKLLRQYGLVFVVTYGTVYCTTFGVIYELVALKYIDAQHAIDWLHSAGVDRFVDLNLISPTAGNFALTWILAKFTEPVRAVATVSITPAVARMVGMAPPKEPSA
ncbi:hypothetical protein BASA81_007981 [Batrachochytrium salamandrivorans]|nr:hypothetical protein BASA81_007981 [Batrachochytrium salamandrivorans]